MDAPIVYTIAEACAAGRVGRTSLYKAIGRGELRAVKRGRRTFILGSDLLPWLQKMPSLTRSAAKSVDGSNSVRDCSQEITVVRASLVNGKPAGRHPWGDTSLCIPQTPPRPSTKPSKQEGLMTIVRNEEPESELGYGPGLERDWPLAFRWRTEESAVADVFPSTGRQVRQDARNAVLTEALLADESNHWVSFSRRKSFYTGRRRYNGTSFTYRSVLAAVADGVEAGLIVEDRALPGSRGRQSRLHATPLLSGWLKDCPVHFEPHEVIWLRDHDGKLVDYAETGRTRRLREEIEAINADMSNTVVELTGPHVHKVGRHWVVAGNYLLPTPPRVYRIFNRGSFEKGGRLYGWWQGLPSQYRAAMTMNGEPVFEPDYAQLHAQIIYAVRGIPLIGDAYETGEFPRNYGKLAFNIAVNAKDHRRANAAISQHLKIDRRIASKLLEAIITKHKAVADVFCSDAGVTLMRIDSDITLIAINDCRSCGIPVLPVHDSLIVQARHAERAAEIMIKAFATRFPHTSNCQVRTKSRMVPQMEEEGSLLRVA